MLMFMLPLACVNKSANQLMRLQVPLLEHLGYLLLHYFIRLKLHYEPTYRRSFIGIIVEKSNLSIYSS